MYLDSTGATQELIGQRNQGTTVTNVVWGVHRTAGGVMRFLWPLGSSTAASADTFGALALSTWYFVAAWRDRRAGTVNIQINHGAINSAADIGAFVPLSTPVRIGAAKNLAGTFVDFWNGRLDEVAVWKRVLGVDTKTYLYKAGVGRPFSLQDPHFHE